MQVDGTQKMMAEASWLIIKFNQYSKVAAVDLYIAILFVPQFVSNEHDIRHRSNIVSYGAEDFYFTCLVVSKQGLHNRIRQRTYHAENTGFLITEVKQRQECLVLGWVTATDYGLDGPGSNPGGDEILRPSRLALEPTQPPVKWAPDFYRG